MQLLDVTDDMEAINDVEGLQQDISDLKTKVKQLKEEHQRIKSEVTALTPSTSFVTFCKCASTKLWERGYQAPGDIPPTAFWEPVVPKYEYFCTKSVLSCSNQGASYAQKSDFPGRDMLTLGFDPGLPALGERCFSVPFPDDLHNKQPHLCA